MAGVAVAHSIVGLDEHLSERVRVKWPNDILVDEHKIAGILLESVSVGARFCAVLGIGINLLQSENELPRDTRWPASSLQLLSSVSISREELLGEILHRLEAGYDLFQAGRTEELTANWSSLSWPVEIEMTVVVGNKTIEGSYAGIGKEGQLLLKQHGTDIQEIYSGEIVRKGPRNE
jgi:BirA family biotin operon repressor/biotin-[acetyl-CoA-carboxylase] ligase